MSGIGERGGEEEEGRGRARLVGLIWQARNEDGKREEEKTERKRQERQKNKRKEQTVLKKSFHETKQKNINSTFSNKTT